MAERCQFEGLAICSRFRNIEKHLESEFDMDIRPDEVQKRSQELHSIFVGLLRNRSLKTLRAVESRNGFEVYRQLQKLFKPSTKPRSMALLSALMSLPNFSAKEKSLHDHVRGLDRLMAEYQRSCGTPVPDEVSLSVLSGRLGCYLVGMVGKPSR